MGRKDPHTSTKESRSLQTQTGSLTGGNADIIVRSGQVSPLAKYVVRYDSFRCSSNSVQTSNKLAECSSSSATASTMALPNM
jgi:hypothetical protein